MSTSRILALTASAAACVLAFTACGGTDQPAEQTGAQPTQEQAPPTQSPMTSASETTGSDAEATTIAVRSGDAGEFLVDGSGTAVYLFTRDEQGVSNCSGQCIENWPAVLGAPQAGDGVDAAKLATIQRENGETQVSYAGHPLYYFVKDTAPGQTNGQSVNDVWYLLTPDGSALEPQDSGGGY